MKLAFTLPIITLLSACGGSSPVGPTFGPTRLLTGPPFTSSYDSAADEYTLNARGTTYTLPGNPAFDVGTFDGAVDMAGRGIFVSETSASRVTLAVISGEFLPAGPFLESFTETTIPASGSATLEGDYVAVLTNSVTNDVDAIISGDASMTMDWRAMTASGDITNRVLRDPTSNSILPDVAVADIILETSDQFSPVSGSFRGGSATGGSIAANPILGVLPTQPSDTNSYQGLLTGANGGEAVGSTSILHFIIGGDERLERGVLALGH